MAGVAGVGAWRSPAGAWRLHGLARRQTLLGQLCSRRALCVGHEADTAWLLRAWLDFGLTDTEAQRATSSLKDTARLARQHSFAAPAFLKSHTELGVGDVARIAMRAPRLLCTPPAAVGEVLKFLHHEIGLSAHDLVKLLPRAPQVLTLSVPSNLHPKLLVLTEEFGMQRPQVRTAVCRFPALLLYSVEGKLFPARRFLLDEVGVEEEQLASLITRSPSVLAFSIPDKLRPTVQFFLDLGFTREEVARLVAFAPPLLAYSVEDNLKPKVEYLRRYMHITGQDLRDQVQQLPALLGYSLLGRIVARHTFLGGVGQMASGLGGIVQVGDVTALTLLKLPKDDRTFCSILRCDEDAFVAHRNWCLEVGRQRGVHAVVRACGLA